MKIDSNVWFIDVALGGIFAGIVVENIDDKYLEVIKAADKHNEDAEIYIFRGKELGYVAVEQGQLMNGKFGGNV